MKFKKTADKINNEVDHLTVIGDINIDQRESNNPMERPKIKPLQPVLDYNLGMNYILTLFITCKYF